MSQNTNPARGMRDFLPADIRRREYVISIIKDVYQKYGFEPLETPAVENIETLMGKYGEEGNQLIFKILKRGEGAATGEADLALRYDLTVPTARVVAEYKDKLPRIFKRYQIQPVWRADRPARGRFREFYQCDVDVFGTKSMVVEAELCAAVIEILTRLKFNSFAIHLNDRKILTAILDSSGISPDKHIDALIALDKIDKIGAERFQEELLQCGIPLDNIEKFGRFMGEFYSLQMKLLHSPVDEIDKYIKSQTGTEHQITDIERRQYFNESALQIISKFIGKHKEGHEGVENLRKILKYAQHNAKIFVDVKLARGLTYYTDTIFEITLVDENFRADSEFLVSVGGGGRYDNLIGMFSGQEIPACGFSLGLERIIVVMTERGMFPEHLTRAPADVLVTIWNEETIADSLELAGELRAQGLRVSVYPEADKLGKQLKYAASIGVAAVAIIGDDERANHTVTIKYLETGTQETIARDRLHTDLKI